MHAHYRAGASLAAVGRHFGRNRKSVHDLFALRGLEIRIDRRQPRRLSSGQIAPLVPAATAKLLDFIKGTEKVRVPRWLQHEWTTWPMKRRAWLVYRLHAAVDARAPERARPRGRFSSNVQPFDYTTTRAHEMAERLNKRRDSRTARTKIFVCSRGVLWRDQPWYWNHWAYYQGPLTKEAGRLALHHAIWEDQHGRKLPPSTAVVFLDGNRNNLTPLNLALKTKNEICRENHANYFAAKGRAKLALLLKRHDRKEHHADHELIRQMGPLRRHAHGIQARPAA
jgi:hypothetical protein